MSTAIAAARAKTKGKRLLREALEGYGADALTLGEWNARKHEAAAAGTWHWKTSDAAATTAAVRERIAATVPGDDSTDATTKRAVLVDLEAEMRAALDVLDRDPEEMMAPTTKSVAARGCQCQWRERIGGRLFHCTNAAPVVPPTKTETSSTTTKTTALCGWHARECRHPEHPMDRRGVLEVPNARGYCLECFAADKRATPPRVGATKIPGVAELSLQRDAQRGLLLAAQTHGRLGAQAPDGGANAAGAGRQCAWTEEHSEAAYVWRCTNAVVQHPTLRGAALAFCGFHAPRCLRSYGAGARATCSTMDRRNAPGLCRNHLEAWLSALPFEARARVVLVESAFDVPGVRECRKDEGGAGPRRRHPLAPREDPPAAHNSIIGPDAYAIVKAQGPVGPPRWSPPALQALVTALSAGILGARGALTAASRTFLGGLAAHDNVVSQGLRELLWRLQFLRRAHVVATRIQRIFRGNRARRRVRALRYERAALRRLGATRLMQRLARGHLGRRAFDRERTAVLAAVPQLQRLVRGGLARRRCRRLRAARRIQDNYRAYRQRCLAWSLREEMLYMRGLQRQAEANYAELQLRVAAFRRLRARRVLRAHVVRWRQRREEAARRAAERLRCLLGAVRIQRGWRRHRHYQHVKQRYDSARSIQRRVRGWLTRHLWGGDPGLAFVPGWRNPRTGVQYGRVLVRPLPSGSYSVPTRRMRMACGALAIQRLFRGHLGRVAANMQWVTMLRRWEWLGVGLGASTSSSLTSSLASIDSMTLGHARYGFMLPSRRYHPERRHHMRPIAGGIKPDRGFAYKYQGILELLADRDGKRAWNPKVDDDDHHDDVHGGGLDEQHDTAPAEGSTRTTTTTTTMASKSKSHQEPGASPASPTVRTKDKAPVSVTKDGVSVGRALFPVGSYVDVASSVLKTTEGDRDDGDDDYGNAGPVHHRARITAVREDPQHRSHWPTYDVEYCRSFLSVRGVRVYNEQHIPWTRLQPIQPTDNKGNASVRARPRKTVGQRIETAIKSLKADIRASIDARLRGTRDLSSEVEPRDEGPLPTVDALVDRLRDERLDRDLLLDPRDFGNFVFRNVSLLRRTWLQVIDHIRYGTRERPVAPTSTSSPSLPASSSSLSPQSPLSPSMLSFYKEFGFAVDRRAVPVARPDRAAEIEARMVAMGFEHDPSANVKADDAEESSTGKTRPETTIPRVQVEPGPVTYPPDWSTARVHDDTALDEIRTGLTTAQDIHRLLYELKTLPRERHREQILEISTRHARAFVCGVPACGRCFSSKEAARLHQQQVHLHQARLASATPLVDQYMHSYWPPQSPWNHEHRREFQSSVGYYPCSHPGCKGIEFQTRRERARHQLQVHGHTDDRQSGSVGSLTSMGPVEEQSQPTASSVAAQSTTMLWLGTYKLCQSHLDEKMGFKAAPREPTTCDAHPRARAQPHRCRKCFVALYNLELPCRLYNAVALPGTRPPDAINSSTETQQTQNSPAEGDKTTASGDRDLEVAGYLIFSADDPSFCPVVREHDVLYLGAGDEKSRQRQLQRVAHRRATKLTGLSVNGDDVELVCVRITSFCRDGNKVDWAIGHAFRRLDLSEMNKNRTPQTRDDGVGNDPCEVVLDSERVIAVRLVDILAAAIVQHCSENVFYRKHHRKDDAHQLRQILKRIELSHRPQTRAVDRITVVLTRFCRLPLALSTPDGGRGEADT